MAGRFVFATGFQSAFIFFRHLSLDHKPETFSSDESIRMDWLYGISITCFAASYLLVFGLEISRVYFRTALRQYLAIGLMAAGLFAHTAYLVLHTGIELSQTGLWTGSWSAWSLAAAWCLAVAYLWMLVRRSDSIAGLFLMPLILTTVAVGTLTRAGGAFSTAGEKSAWSMVHGLSLLLGTAVVALGFAFGLMYLMQARRLKKKLMPSGLFRMPSLEWLQNACERALVGSAILLGLGLISGLIVNLINNRIAGATPGISTQVVAWNDPVVWSSGILFAWLLASMLFNLLYRPARQGRKVAYLVVTSFLFLVLELGIVWWAGHAMDRTVTHSIEQQTRMSDPTAGGPSAITRQVAMTADASDSGQSFETDSSGRGV